MNRRSPSWRLACLTFAVGAFAAAAEEPAPVIKAPRAYTNRVQMHQVDLTSTRPPSAPQTVREPFAADPWSEMPSDGLPAAGDFVTPPVVAHAPPPLPEEKKDKKRDWILLSPREQILQTDNQEEKKESGWGWLADEVMHSRDQQSTESGPEENEPEAQDPRDRDAGSTNLALDRVDRQFETSPAGTHDFDRMQSTSSAQDDRSQWAAGTASSSNTVSTSVVRSQMAEESPRDGDPAQRERSPRPDQDPSLATWKRADLAPRWDAWRAPDGQREAAADGRAAPAGRGAAAAAGEQPAVGLPEERFGGLDRSGSFAMGLPEHASLGQVAEGSAGRSFSALGADTAETLAAGGGAWSGSRSAWGSESASGDFRPSAFQPSATLDAGTPSAALSAPLRFDNTPSSDFGSEPAIRTTTLPW